MVTMIVITVISLAILGFLMFKALIFIFGRIDTMVDSHEEELVAITLADEAKWLREALENARKLPFGYSYHFLEGFEAAVEWVERHAQTPDVRPQPDSLISGFTQGDIQNRIFGEDPVSDGD